MQEYTIAIAGHKITVTTTATLLSSLIDTAASAAQSLPKDLDEVILLCEDGDIRIATDGTTPTALLGELLVLGEKKTITGIALSKIKLIRAGSADVAVSVRVGWRDPKIG